MRKKSLHIYRSVWAVGIVGVTYVRGCPYSSVWWNDSSARKEKVAGHAPTRSTRRARSSTTPVNERCKEKRRDVQPDQLFEPSDGLSEDTGSSFGVGCVLLAHDQQPIVDRSARVKLLLHEEREGVDLCYHSFFYVQ